MRPLWQPFKNGMLNSDHHWPLALPLLLRLHFALSLLCNTYILGVLNVAVTPSHAITLPHSLLFFFLPHQRSPQLCFSLSTPPFSMGLACLDRAVQSLTVPGLSITTISSYKSGVKCHTIFCIAYNFPHSSCRADVVPFCGKLGQWQLIMPICLYLSTLCQHRLMDGGTTLLYTPLLLEKP